MRLTKKKQESLERQVFEYEVTLTKIIPRCVQNGDDAVTEEIFHLLSNREWLEKQFDTYGTSGVLTPLWRRVQELDEILIAQREMILDVYPRYRSERRRLRIPKKYWWWYLDEREAVKPKELAAA